MAKKPKASKPKPAPTEVVEAVAEVETPNAENPGDQDDDQGDDDDGMPVLFMGEPFALAGVDADESDDGGQDGQLLEENPASGVPGCFASVLCGCGQPFKIDLLTKDVKACPGCDSRFSHMLVICAESDTRIVGHTWHHLLKVNGLMVDDDDDDDGDGDAEQPAEIPDAK